jgi:parallel beta helix pectate lyase-like protein
MRHELRFVIALLMLAGAANAAQRTFVSAGSGSDANACTRQLPCRNFAAAMTATHFGGEVVVLDSGGYGAVTITQSLSLISPLGVYAGITGFTGSAIQINAPGGTVILRGLFLNGQGGTFGITLTAAGIVHVENVVINGFASNALQILDASETFVKDSEIRGNGDSAIIVAPASGWALLTVDSVRMEGNLYGLVADSGSQLVIRNAAAVRNPVKGFWFRSAGSLGVVRATVDDSVATDVDDSFPAGGAGFGAENGARVAIRNSVSSRNQYGFWASESPAGTEMILDRCLATETGNGIIAGAGGGAGTALVTVSNSTVSNSSANGIVAGSNGTVRAFGNTVTRNGTGINGQLGTFDSLGHNAVHGNTAETLGTINSIPPM